GRSPLPAGRDSRRPPGAAPAAGGRRTARCLDSRRDPRTARAPGPRVLARGAAPAPRPRPARERARAAPRRRARRDPRGPPLDRAGGPAARLFGGRPRPPPGAPPARRDPSGGRGRLHRRGAAPHARQQDRRGAYPRDPPQDAPREAPELRILVLSVGRPDRGPYGSLFEDYAARIRRFGTDFEARHVPEGEA